MAYCSKCGKPLKENAKFCFACGAKNSHSDIDDAASPGSNQTDSAVEDNLAQSNQITAEQQDETVPVTGEVLADEEETSSADQPPAGNPDTQPTRNRSGLLYMLLGILLTLCIVGAIYIFATRQNTNARDQNNQTEEQAQLADDLAEEEQADVIGEVSISNVDLSQYPTVKIKLTSDDFDEATYQQIPITVKENDREISEISRDINPSDDNAMVLSYLTDYINTENAAQTITLSVAVADHHLTTSLQAPVQQEIATRYFSYNTDNYPEVKLYYSLIGVNEAISDAILENTQYYQFNEEGKALLISKISKVSDLEESLSIDIVIDTSTSMIDDNNLSKVTNVAENFVNSIDMNRNDRISLMSFSGPEQIYQAQFSNQVAPILSNIQNIVADGWSTSLYKALQEAVMATAYNGQSGSKYIIVFTDGQDNDSGYVTAGTVINDALQLGVQIYAVGMYEDSELRNIAESTDGEYFNVQSDLSGLYDLYNTIYQRKKNQYVLTYQSALAQKVPRNISLQIQSPLYRSSYQTTMTPKVLGNVDVANCMREYQIRWAEALTNLDTTRLAAVTNTENLADTSVYKIVRDQVKSRSWAINNRGDYSAFQTPIFKLLNAEKLSETHYQLTTMKQFVQELYKNGRYEKSFFMERTYTYNVIKKNGVWLVDSVTSLDSPATFYTDETFTVLHPNQDF